MKVLIIDESIDRIGGVERVICTIANELSVKNDVIVLSEFKVKKEPFYKYKDNIERRYLIDATKQKTNILKNKGVVYYLFRCLEKIRDRIFLPHKIKKFISSLVDIDVIIFGRVFVALDFLPIIKKYNKKIQIIVRDAIHLEYFNKNVKEKILKYFPDMVTRFIVSSNESIKEYEKFFNEASIKMTKIFNPLGIKPIKKYNFSRKTIVTLGRLDEQKGFENLIDAFEKVHEKHLDWNLEIYGNGNYEKFLRKKIKEQNAEAYVKILPPTKNVVEVFNNSSIFVLPSRYEGYANVLVEALACGMPCISYNWLMGVEEIIKDRENGIIVPLMDRKKYFEGCVFQQDIDNLAEKINYLIEQPELCEKLSEQASRIIETRNIDTIIKQWVQIIEG